MAIKYPPTRVTTNLALCGLVLLIIFTCKAQPSSEEKERVKRHWDVVNHFRCGPPQPRSFTIQDLLDSPLEPSEIAQPPVTVLYRCDNGSGCCLSTLKVCAMELEEDVDLLFLIKDPFRNHSHYREIKAKNHTWCSCQSIGNPIK